MREETVESAARKMPPASMLHFLLSAIEAGSLGCINGLYSLCIPDLPADNAIPGARSRTSHPWVEGNRIPSWVQALAQGPEGCGAVLAVAEVDKATQKQRWPQFILVHIDIRLSVITCRNTSKTITAHVLRYQPLDTAISVMEATHVL